MHSPLHRRRRLKSVVPLPNPHRAERLHDPVGKRKARNATPFGTVKLFLETRKDKVGLAGNLRAVFVIVPIDSMPHRQPNLVSGAVVPVCDQPPKRESPLRPRLRIRRNQQQLETKSHCHHRKLIGVWAKTNGVHWWVVLGLAGGGGPVWPRRALI